jgi:hypothetical protein
MVAIEAVKWKGAADPLPYGMRRPACMIPGPRERAKMGYIGLSSYLDLASPPPRTYHSIWIWSPNAHVLHGIVELKLENKGARLSDPGWVDYSFLVLSFSVCRNVQAQGTVFYAHACIWCCGGCFFLFLLFMGMGGTWAPRAGHACESRDGMVKAL